MLRPRITTVFRSKWRALWWAASIVASVVTLAPRLHGPHPAESEPTAKPKHVNPWAKTPN